jgi:DNA-binding transcriptional ArsR family regulator
MRRTITARDIPPFRADHVGSLLRPRLLLRARDDFASGQITPAQLRAIEDEAIAGMVAMRREAGLRSATDGEFRRASCTWTSCTSWAASPEESRETSLDRCISREYSRDMSSEDAGSKPSPESTARPGVREISDAQTMRALAHPVRIALLETLSLGDPMTATELGEQIGESPTTCSFHLRQLAKYGFVEEAGGGKGRARPWRVTWMALHFTSASDNAEYEIAAGALSRLVRERQLDRYRTWVETRATYPRQWRKAATDSEYLFYLTAGELEQLNEELNSQLMLRFRDRITDPSLRPPGSAPVELLMFSFPLGLPSEETSDTTGDPS